MSKHPIKDDSKEIYLKKAQDRFFAAMVDFEEIKKKAKKALEFLDESGGYLNKGILDLEEGNYIYFSSLQFDHFRQKNIQKSSWACVKYVSFLGSCVELEDGGRVHFSNIERCRLHGLKLVGENQ